MNALSSSLRATGLYALIFLTASCRPSPAEVPVISIDNPAGAIDLRLSDLLDDITLVPLDSRDDVLLPSSARFVVSEHHILAATQTELHQFDRTGKYVRKLAVQGNGPGEFNTILDILIDERRDIACYSDFKDPSLISRIDLGTGQFLEPLRPGCGSVTIKAVDQDGALIGYPSASVISIGGGNEKGKDSSALVFSYHPDQHDTQIIRGYHPFTSVPFFGCAMFSYQDKTVYYTNIVYSDTLFQVARTQLTPQYVLRFNDPLADLVTGGHYLTFPVCYRDGIIIVKMHASYKRNENTVMFTAQSVHTLHLNKAHRLNLIRSITIDPLALRVNFAQSDEKQTQDTAIRGLPNIVGKWGCIPADAPDMMEAMQQALANDQLAPDYRKTIEELSAQINDDSNPVLIVGKVR